MNFKNALVVAIGALLLILLLYLWNGFSLFYSIIPLVFLLILIVFGSARIDSNFFVSAICSVDTDESVFSITFDDGPNGQFTPEVIDVLDEYSVKACFFLIGSNIRGQEELVMEMHRKGHELGNHTYTHSYTIDAKGRAGFEREIKETDDALEQLGIGRPNYFRPPYGVTTPGLAAACKKLGHKVIGWNIRSLDTTKDSEEVVYQRVVSKLKPGSIVLFHDNSTKTVRVLRRVLEYAKLNGLRVVPLHELTGIPVYR